VELFHWALNDIDETDIESLIPFVFGYPEWKKTRSAASKRRMLFADEADFLM
jgi:hypothetical protein